MLALDKAGLAEPDLQEAVASNGSEFGTVKVVNAALPNEKSDYVVVMVTMANPDEAAAVDRKIGDANVDSTAVIRLKLEVTPV